MIKYICVNNYQLFIMISKNYVKKRQDKVCKQHKRQLRGLQEKEEKR